MLDFFFKNPLDFLLSDNPLYFMNLHMEIIIASRTGSTSVNIEIDQTASGVAFLALLTHNKPLASVCNLIGGIFKCPYTHCMENFLQFYETNFSNKNADFEKCISSDRKLHKYTLMCYIYGQGPSGRIEDFKERWIEVYKKNLLLM
jgi:hypothetical protein